MDEQWSQLAEILCKDLPEIDNCLSQSNIPLSKKADLAFDIILDTMLEVSDLEKFLVSEAHGKIRIIVSNWFRQRYGKVSSSELGLKAAVMLRESPFLMIVPRNFKVAAEQPGQVWIGLPASVQSEERSLNWVVDQAVVDGLTAKDRVVAEENATGVGNFIRSIGYDLNALQSDADTNIADLAESVSTDLQASATHLCERSNAGLRSSCWEISQATEKALKLFLCRKGVEPPWTHDLDNLATAAEGLGLEKVYRSKLKNIPSNSAATSLRYGGEMSLSSALRSYFAALPLLTSILKSASPDAKYNMREARFKIQTPPWFAFNTQEFSDQIRSHLRDRDVPAED